MLHKVSSLTPWMESIRKDLQILCREVRPRAKIQLATKAQLQCQLCHTERRPSISMLLLPSVSDMTTCHWYSCFLKVLLIRMPAVKHIMQLGPSLPLSTWWTLMSLTWPDLPGHPPIFLHAASNQKLVVGMAWNEAECVEHGLHTVEFMERGMEWNGMEWNGK